MDARAPVFAETIRELVEFGFHLKARGQADRRGFGVFVGGVCQDVGEGWEEAIFGDIHDALSECASWEIAKDHGGDEVFV